MARCTELQARLEELQQLAATRFIVITAPMVSHLNRHKALSDSSKLQQFYLSVEDNRMDHTFHRGLTCVFTVIWIREKEPLLSSEDYGDSLTASQTMELRLKVAYDCLPC